MSQGVVRACVCVPTSFVIVADDLVFAEEKGLGPFGLVGVTRPGHRSFRAKVTARTPRRCVNCKYYNKVNVTTGKSVTTPRLALVCGVLFGIIQQFG